MDRTEGVETLKKELFEIKLSRAMRQGSIADRVELVKREEKVNKLLNMLLTEIEIAQGQVAFAFLDQIDVSKLDDVGIK